MVKDKIILGIDPGTQIMGYGLLQIKNNKMSVLAMGSINLQKVDNHALKLKKIFERTTYLINEYKPDESAIEAPFMGKNAQSMLKLGRAQGVAMAAALVSNLPITEYSPKSIKQAITGKGTASKEQVAAMLMSLLKIEKMPVHLDATDGLAAAVCHFFQIKNGGIMRGKKGNGWSSFIKNNPQRITR